MISPEILKRSAVAGALSVAVVGGVAAVAPGWSEADCEFEDPAWADGSEVSLESRTRMPQPVVRKAPPPGGAESSSETRTDGDARERARIQARNRAADRAMEQLEHIYETHGPVTGAQRLDLLQTRVDRALRHAETRTAKEIIRGD